VTVLRWNAVASEPTEGDAKVDRIMTDLNDTPAPERIADRPHLGLTIGRAVAIRLIAVGAFLATLVAVDVGLAASGDTGAAARPPVSGR
jgi:hypothetical protein